MASAQPGAGRGLSSPIPQSFTTPRHTLPGDFLNFMGKLMLKSILPDFLIVLTAFALFALAVMSMEANTQPDPSVFRAADPIEAEAAK